jgi:hypothetical protein
VISPVTPRVPTPERPELRHLVPVPTGARALPAVDIDGVDIEGRPQTLRVAQPGRWTLLVFVGSHCDGCLPFWKLAGAPAQCGLAPRDTIALVSRGPSNERPDALAALMATWHGSRSALGLIMSDTAWRDYRVHGAPFFVLLDGVEVTTEGVAWSAEQLASDVGRARARPAQDAPAHPRARR